MQNRHMSFVQVSAHLGKSERTVAGWIRKGLFPAASHRQGRRLFWLLSDVQEAAARLKTPLPVEGATGSRSSGVA